jgi:hypothetical protein
MMTFLVVQVAQGVGKARPLRLGELTDIYRIVEDGQHRGRAALERCVKRLQLIWALAPEGTSNS